jgi:hypothetical protein
VCSESIMKRLVSASLIAPLAAPVLYYAGALTAALLDPVRRGSVGQSLLSGLAVVLAVGAPIAYAATFGAGLPALWIVRRAGPLTIGRTVLVGLLAGVGVAIVIAPSTASWYPFRWLRGTAAFLGRRQPRSGTGWHSPKDWRGV